MTRGKNDVSLTQNTAKLTHIYKYMLRYLQFSSLRNSVPHNYVDSIGIFAMNQCKSRIT